MNSANCQWIKLNLLCGKNEILQEKQKTNYFHDWMVHIGGIQTIPTE